MTHNELSKGDDPQVSSSSLLNRLTAFVLKSFSQAQSHIFVEDSHITDSLTWLSRKQKENGCFQRSGSLLNNAIKVMPSNLFWSLRRVKCMSCDAPMDSSSPGDITLRRTAEAKAFET